MVGFLEEVEDEFWVFDGSAWAVRRFRGHHLRRGGARGKGRGKGSKGFKRFRSRKLSKRGKFNLAADDYNYDESEPGHNV